MQTQHTENLADYVRRKVNEKGVSLKDVERASRNQISSQYISDIMTGIAANPSIEKLRALAHGLGASEDELFMRARGVRPTAPQMLEGKINSISMLSSKLNDDDLKWCNETLEMIEHELHHRINRENKSAKSIETVG